MASNGLFASVRCEPRQARKGATVVVKYCAGVRLLVVITLSNKENDSLAGMLGDADAHFLNTFCTDRFGVSLGYIDK